MPDRRRRSLHRPASVLSIAGSDSGGGAGIQADLKAFAAHGVHGLTAIAAITAQNTRAVTAVHAVPIAVLRAQIEALFDDFDVRAIKIGMLGTRRVIREVAALLDRPGCPPIVLDPVMIASSGAALLQPDAVDALRSRLMPLASVITPNLPEAEHLLGRRIRDAAAVGAAALALCRSGAKSVLLKGGHAPGTRVRDVFVDQHGLQLEIEHRRLAVEGHGTGCTLSASIAANLARGTALRQAVVEAVDYVHGALQGAYRPGRGRIAVLDHGWSLRRLRRR